MRAVAYCRYSTDNQTENSIAYQLDTIKKYCKENDITLVDFFIDEAQSGTNTDRQAFQEMLEQSKTKKFEAVVIYDVSRGSRDVADWFNFRKDMAMLNIKILSATEKLGDMANPNDFLVELINVGLGQHMVLQTRQKSIAGVTEKAKTGVFLGGTPPLGYDVVNGQYVINEIEAKAVKAIYNIYANGGSYYDILDKMLEDNVKTKKGRPFGSSSLHSILRNERYIGIYSWNKHSQRYMRKWVGKTDNPNKVVIEDAIPPIIDKNTWERVQTRLKTRARATNKAKQTYLLTGLITCNKCGSTYVAHCSTNSKGYSTRYYICGNKYRTKTCDAANVNADELELFVTNCVKLYLTGMNFEEIAQQLCDQVNNASVDLRKEKSELTTITTQLKNGMNAVLNGMDYPELREEMDKLRMRKSELEDIIFSNEHIKKELDPKKVVKLLDDKYDLLNTDMKSVISDLVKVYANENGTYAVNIGVHLNGSRCLQQPLCTTFTFIPKKLLLDNIPSPMLQ